MDDYRTISFEIGMAHDRSFEQPFHALDHLKRAFNKLNDVEDDKDFQTYAGQIIFVLNDVQKGVGVKERFAPDISFLEDGVERLAKGRAVTVTPMSPPPLDPS
ncbi:MAG: hypothetical protein AAF549_04760 [Pseudomonadota bacterium]